MDTGLRSGPSSHSSPSADQQHQQQNVHDDDEKQKISAAAYHHAPVKHQVQFRVHGSGGTAVVVGDYGKKVVDSDRTDSSAISYVEQVEARLLKHTREFLRFAKILKDFADSATDIMTFVELAFEILAEHRDLFFGLQCLLPPGYTISFVDDLKDVAEVSPQSPANFHGPSRYAEEYVPESIIRLRRSPRAFKSSKTIRVNPVAKGKELKDVNETISRRRSKKRESESSIRKSSKSSSKVHGKALVNSMEARGTNSFRPKAWPASVEFSDVLKFDNSSAPTIPREVRDFLDRKNVEVRVIEDSKHPAYCEERGMPAGKGVFAKSSIRKGTVVFNYTGKLTFSPKALPQAEGHYIFKVAETSNYNIEIDASAMGNESRFVNDHRGVLGVKGPNVFFVVARHRDVGTFGVVHMKTLRKVRSGEELLVSYGRDYWR